jgi:hypothetical protein
MSKAIQLRFDYVGLDPDTRIFVLERTERIHNLARMTATGIVQIGQYLTEVKERMPGRFLDWIVREFAWKRTTAWRFMEVFEKVKCSKLEQLEIDVSALYLIAAPSTPEPVRNEVLRRAGNGEPVTHAGTRALVQHFADTGELPEIEVGLAALIEQRRGAAKPEPPLVKISAAATAEMERLHREMKANSERMHAVMSVIRAIECLATTSLTVSQIADEIRRLDSPDRDWQGQTKQARKILADLGSELKS